MPRVHINNECNISIYPEYIRRFIGELLTDTNLCLSGRLCSVQPVFGNSNSGDDINEILVSIPYADQIFRLKVLFDKHDPDFAPDFLFDHNTFMSDPDLEEISKYVPSYLNWDANDPRALCKVLKEFLNLFKQHQVHLLEKHSEFRPNFEYTSLVGETDVKADDIEVLVEKNAAGVLIVYFLIKLNVDFSELPISPDFVKNPYPDAGLLSVIFRDAVPQEPQLFLSSRVETALGDASSLHIPKFTKENCLMDYVPSIHKLLFDHVASVANNYNKKREFISYVLALHGSQVLEYDSVGFSHIALLFNTSDFFWFLKISLSTSYPAEQPRFEYQSVLLPTQYVQLNDYPYSPRWKPQQMLDRAFKKIFDSFESFKAAAISKAAQFIC